MCESRWPERSDRGCGRRLDRPRRVAACAARSDPLTGVVCPDEVWRMWLRALVPLAIGAALTAVPLLSIPWLHRAALRADARRDVAIDSAVLPRLRDWATRPSSQRLGTVYFGDSLVIGSGYIAVPEVLVQRLAARGV